MAHSPPEGSDGWQSLKDHAEGVTRLLEQHVEHFGFERAGQHARWVGLLHDLGKYRVRWQRERLGWDPQAGQPMRAGRASVPHADAGAGLYKIMHSKVAPLQDATNSEIPFVILSHHSGLKDQNNLHDRIRDVDGGTPALQEMWNAAQELGGVTGLQLVPSSGLSGTSRALYTRMLLSALVDADRLDTEGHGSPQNAELRARRAEAQGNMLELLGRVRAHIEGFKGGGALNAARRDLYEQALKGACERRGFQRLTLPTGAGKTLTSLAFALKHAHEHGLRRVIYAVPFTTVIDQTAEVFRGVLGEENVLEHHSALDLGTDDEGEDSAQRDWLTLAAENWDAPVVVSTTVQLFESLFASRTSKLRKIHNVSGSVIVLDEAQSLPVARLHPILDALRELVEHYRVSVVFCTATQPAFDDFPGLAGVREIVENPVAVFAKDVFRRVRYDLRLEGRTLWAQVADELREEQQAMCVVNTRKDALALFEALRDLPGTFHLSTNMCAAHRKEKLAEVRRRLQDGLPCRVVSTQLIEAGVDVSFPAVWRAVGPLEALVQAAGRCNRHGELGAEGGRVVVFVPEEHKLPPGDYEVRESVAREVLGEGGNLDDVEVFKAYFRRVYRQTNTDSPARWEEGGQPYEKTFAQLAGEMNFERIALEFRMIDQPTVSLLVRAHNPAVVDQQLEIITERVRLATKKDCAVRAKAVRAAWRTLGQYMVGVPKYRLDNAEFRAFTSVVPELAEKARLLRQEAPGQLQWTGRYDPEVGLVQDYDHDLFTSF